jgi:GNAT superfamily N-acetyltransferase
MPEGDVVWQTARRLHEALAGRVLTRSDFRVPRLATADLSGDAAGEVTWRSVQRHPPINIEIYGCDRAAWPVFARYHYLSADLASAAQCFGMWCDGRLVAFSSHLRLPHAKVRNIKLAHRLVVLPDFQGIGLGPLFADWHGQYLYERDYRLHFAISRPVLIRAFTRSPRWREVGNKPRLQVGPKSAMRGRQLDPRRLSSRVFEYQAPKPKTG